MKEVLLPLLAYTMFAAAFAVSAQPTAPNGSLQGKRVAILVADGFEQSELMEPKKALEAAGAKTSIVSPEDESVKGWNEKQWGKNIPVDVPLASAKPDQFDVLLLPGGVMNPDKLRMTADAVKFVKAFTDAGKPVAAICHGPWTLIEADAVRGRKLTSWPSLKTDVRNAGGTWTDAEVVVDKGLVTSRKPADIPAFNREMIRAFSQAGK
jgi:protease I